MCFKNYHMLISPENITENSRRSKQFSCRNFWKAMEKNKVCLKKVLSFLKVN